ncbi:MAG TPA: peptide deformylase [Candidatus Saccharimonadales bacterium]|jgi:peptide deformylase
MTKEDIISLPNPHLRTKSKQVKSITKTISKIVDDMTSATVSWDRSREHEFGVALAAIQIDQPYRIIIVRNDLENKDDMSFTAYINPEIIKLYGDIIEEYEGCLSVPDIYGKVPRYSKARIRAMDLNGKTVNLTVSGFVAKTFQHEIDHTEGVLFIDKIKEMSGAFYRLNEEGKLAKLDYQKDVQENPILW